MGFFKSKRSIDSLKLKVECFPVSIKPEVEAYTLFYFATSAMITKYIMFNLGGPKLSL